MIDASKISYSIGKLIYLCENSPVHAEIYDTIHSMIKSFKNILDAEVVIHGIVDMFDEYGHEELTNEHIIDMLKAFNLKLK